MKTVKTTKIKLIIIACILPLLFVACSNDGNPNEPTVSPFPFMKIGNQWYYEANAITDKYRIGYRHEVSIVSTVTEDNCFSVSTVASMTVGPLEPDDDDLVELVRIVNFHPSGHNHPVWVAKNDYLATIGTMQEIQPPFPVVFNVNTVGKKWESPFKDRDLGALYREILSTSETVEIDLGTFTNCIKVKETCERDPEYYYIYWISKEYGIVKYEKRKFEYRFDVQQYVITKGELRWKNF